MEEINRVFFHELGHFIAHEMIRKFYNGSGVKLIAIFPHGQENNLFEGLTQQNLSADEGERYTPKKPLLAQYLASSTYGCIFQAYYKHQSLQTCFKENGENDTEKWRGSLSGHGLQEYAPDIFAIEKEYFDELVGQSKLDELMQLDPEKYLVHIGSQNYNVDLELLRSDTAAFIDSHRDDFESLLTRYSQIIK